MISLGIASALNSAVYLGPDAPLPENWRQVDFIEDAATGVIMGHYANADQHYLAVRGVWGKSDIMPALRVFLGADPVDRIMFVQDKIMALFGGDPDPQTLAIGGHSLGGLIAAAAAERFELPGLAQNSPGWMTRQPDSDRLQKFLQVRTARDVVADWGTSYPRNLMLPDPLIPDWSLSGLHNLEHQNQLIIDHGIAHYRVDDHTLSPPTPGGKACPPTQVARIGRALQKLRTARQYTQTHGRPVRQAKP